MPKTLKSQCLKLNSEKLKAVPNCLSIPKDVHSPNEFIKYIFDYGEFRIDSFKLVIPENLVIRKSELLNQLIEKKKVEFIVDSISGEILFESESDYSNNDSIKDHFNFAGIEFRVSYDQYNSRYIIHIHSKILKENYFNMIYSGNIQEVLNIINNTKVIEFICDIDQLRMINVEWSLNLKVDSDQHESLSKIFDSIKDHLELDSDMLKTRLCETWNDNGHNGISVYKLKGKNRNQEHKPSFKIYFKTFELQQNDKTKPFTKEYLNSYDLNNLYRLEIGVRTKSDLIMERKDLFFKDNTLNEIINLPKQRLNEYLIRKLELLFIDLDIIEKTESIPMTINETLTDALFLELIDKTFKKEYKDTGLNYSVIKRKMIKDFKKSGFLNNLWNKQSGESKRKHIRRYTELLERYLFEVKDQERRKN